MLLMIRLAALVAVGVGGETAVRLCLWFIAYQCCMAYMVAGFAKVTAAGWRAGQFLPGAVGTTTYGTQFVGGFLRHHRRLAVAGSWMVLLFENEFPRSRGCYHGPGASPILCSGAFFTCPTRS